MRVTAEPQVKHEIHRIDSLISHLHRLYAEARALHGSDLRESVTMSLDDIMETLRDERTKLQFLVDHPIRH